MVFDSNKPIKTLTKLGPYPNSNIIININSERGPFKNVGSLKKFNKYFFNLGILRLYYFYVENSIVS